MILQIDEGFALPLGTGVILIFLMILMMVLYVKYRVPLLIITVYMFSLLLGYESLSIEIPLTPYFQIFFLLFQSVLFILTAMDFFSKKEKEL